MIEGVFGRLGTPQYAVSDSGTLVYVPGTAAAQRTLVWVGRNGKEEPVAAPANAYSHPSISPDGMQVALDVETGGNRDIWIWHLSRETMTRFTFDKATECFPLLTRDGKRIAFASNREGDYGIYWKAADGTGDVEHLGSMEGRSICPSSWVG